MVNENIIKYFVSALIVVVLFSILAVFVAEQVNSNDLKEYNTFDNSSTQSLLTSSTATLTPVGEGISSSSVTGKNNSWINFSGGYVEYGNPSILNFSDGQDFTVSLWFNTLNTSINFQGLLGLGAPYSTSPGLNVYLTDAPIMGYQLSNGSNSSSGSFTIDYSANEWHNVIVSFDRDDEGTIYIDGNLGYTNLDISSNELGSIYTSTWRLGSYGNLGSSQFRGNLQNLKFYNSSFNQAQVKEIYETSSTKAENLTYIPVMMYHYYNATGSLEDLGLTWVNETVLREQLDFFNDTGYETITTDEYYNWTIDGGFTMPERPIIFVWDDGYNHVLNVAPIYAEYGYVGVSGIISGIVGTGNIMNWTEINTMVDTYGWGLSSHGMSNDRLPLMSSADRISNFSESKQLIYDNVGINVTGFIFAGNDYGANDAQRATIMSECGQYYNSCFGRSWTMGTNVWILFDDRAERYITENSNGTNGDLVRIGVYNSTTIKEMEFSLNFTSLNEDSIAHFATNENNGTISYDSKNNANYGNLTGSATWGDDGVDVALIPTTDYTISSTGLFTIVNDDYTWAGLDASWIFTDGQYEEYGFHTSIIKLVAGFVALGMLAFVILILFKIYKEEGIM